MPTQAFLRPAAANRIRVLSLRAFATRKLLGKTFDVVFLRDIDRDGNPTPQEPQNVLVKMAAREATPTRGEVSVYMGADGELQKEVFDVEADGTLTPVPFNVKKGDHFKYEGATGVVSLVLPEEAGIVRAPFTLRG